MENEKVDPMEYEQKKDVTFTREDSNLYKQLRELAASANSLDEAAALVLMEITEDEDER